MGLFGGGETKTVVQQDPSMMIPTEAKPGYTQGRTWMSNILANPPVYGGKRVADISPLQQQFLTRAGTELGTQSGVSSAAEKQLVDTLNGLYLNGPLMQQAVGSAAEPLFANLVQQVLPALRGTALQVGHGGESNRMTGEQENIIDSFARSLGTSVVAPIYGAERQNQLTAAGQTGQFTMADLAQLTALQNAGTTERGFEQEALAAEREKFEEPLYRQGQVAGSLTNVPYATGGTTTTTGYQTPGMMSGLSSLLTLGILGKALGKG